VVRRRRCFHCDQEGHMRRSCPDLEDKGELDQPVKESDKEQVSEENAEAEFTAGSARGRGLARWWSRGSWIAGATSAKQGMLPGLNEAGQGHE
jgi:hypothetical protein